MRRPQDDHIRWAAQVVTFYAPAQWGLGSPAELLAWSRSQPTRFWDRLLDQIASCGVDYIELCFEPGDWTSLLAAYGTANDAAAALSSRGLFLSGSYQGGGHRLEAAIDDPGVARTMVDEVRRHARFVRALGARTIMTGPPRRFPLTRDYDAVVPAVVFDRLAIVLDAMGKAAIAEDVRLAVHTEAMSCVCRPDDIASIMSRTDPAVVGLCIDAGHVTLDGGVPADVMAAHGDRVRNVHWKDAAGRLRDLPSDGNVTHELMMERFRRAGSGVVDWAALTRAMAARGFDGVAAVEHDLSPDPIADTRAVLALFDDALAPVYA